MNKEKHKNIVENIKKHPKIEKAVIFLEDAAPKPIMVIFYGMLIYLAIGLDIRVIPCAVIPWAVFFLVTVISKKLNFKRPFEELDFEPITPHSKGRSCPSRHASSSAVITTATFYISPILGAVTAFFAVIVCATRVLAGVHYIRDVLLGIIIGGGLGSIAFFVVSKFI